MFGLLCKIAFSQEHSKPAQSGHTDCHARNKIEPETRCYKSVSI